MTPAATLTILGFAAAFILGKCESLNNTEAAIFGAGAVILVSIILASLHAIDLILGVLL